MCFVSFSPVFQNSYRRGYAPMMFLAILAGICGSLWPVVCAASAILPSPFPSCLSGHGFAQSGFISPEKSAKKSGLHNRPFMKRPVCCTLVKIIPVTVTHGGAGIAVPQWFIALPGQIKRRRRISFTYTVIKYSNTNPNHQILY